MPGVGVRPIKQAAPDGSSQVSGQLVCGLLVACVLRLDHVVIDIPLAVDFADDIDRHFGAVACGDDRMHADASCCTGRPDARDIRFAACSLPILTRSGPEISATP